MSASANILGSGRRWHGILHAYRVPSEERAAALESASQRPAARDSQYRVESRLLTQMPRDIRQRRSPPQHPCFPHAEYPECNADRSGSRDNQPRFGQQEARRKRLHLCVRALSPGQWHCEIVSHSFPAGQPEIAGPARLQVPNRGSHAQPGLVQDEWSETCCSTSVSTVSLTIPAMCQCSFCRGHQR